MAKDRATALPDSNGAAAWLASRQASRFPHRDRHRRIQTPSHLMELMQYLQAFSFTFDSARCLRCNSNFVRKITCIRTTPEHIQDTVFRSRSPQKRREAVM